MQHEEGHGERKRHKAEPEEEKAHVELHAQQQLQSNGQQAQAHGAEQDAGKHGDQQHAGQQHAPGAQQHAHEEHAEQHQQNGEHGAEQRDAERQAAQQAEEEKQQQSDAPRRCHSMTEGGPPTCSLIVSFYREGAEDSMGRTLEEMLAYDDETMERCHDHMQWMFPLHEPSMFAHDYEILTPQDVEQLSASDAARRNMAAAGSRFRAFLGIGQPPQPQKWAQWARAGNHNMLRVTRAIRSMRLFGMEEEAQELFEAAMQVALARKLPRTTQQYWRMAARDPVMHSLRSGGAAGAGAGGMFDGRQLAALLGLRRG